MKPTLSPGADAVGTEFIGAAFIGRDSFVTRSIIGDYFSVGWNSFVADCHVGSFCAIASRVSIGAFSHPTDWLSIHEFQYRDTHPIWGKSIFDPFRTPTIDRSITRIGSDVWIGDNAVVLTGVEIGTGVVVGAGAVVTKSLEPYGIYIGNPARLLRYRFREDIVEQLLALKWWERSLDSLKGIDFWNVEKAIQQLRNQQ